MAGWISRPAIDIIEGSPRSDKEVAMFPVKIKFNNTPMGLIILIVILVMILMIITPIVTISAINAIFRTEIPVNFVTWVSVLWLHMAFGKTSSKS